MKKLNYFVLLIPFLFLSCSKDSASPVTPVTPAAYSVVGFWKTTSSVLNGVELFGGTNPVKSEGYYFDANGSFSTQSYTDTNYTNLYSYSTGTFAIPRTSTINLEGNEYSSSDVFINSYNLSCQVVKLNATQLEIKVLNYPAANDIYVKKFVR